MKTLITFATHREAEAFITHPQSNPLSPYLFSWENALILIVGMGKEYIEERLTPLLQDDISIINIGLCGALKSDLPLGSLHQVRAVYQEGIKKPIILSNEGVNLQTVEKPLYNPSEGQKSSFDIVDMEGFYIASLAQKKKRPCTLYKMVSDYCTEMSSIHIAERLPYLSNLLFQAFFQNSYSIETS